MTIGDDVTAGVRRALEARLAVRDGRKVPEKRDLAFLNGGGAVRLDATYAYADLANSSGLAQHVRQEVAANIIRAYVHAAAKTFRAYGGEIRSFDGDRVMAIFAGEEKNALAVRAALALNWAVDKVASSPRCKRTTGVGSFEELPTQEGDPHPCPPEYHPPSASAPR